jgi:protein-tyrosine phosphatase
VSADPTRIALKADPRTRRMTGVTAHGYIPFDVPFITEIVPGLWQGGCEDGLVLPAHIKHVVSLYPWEKYKVRHELASMVAVRMKDGTGEDMGPVPVLAAWVNACRKSGPVLVSCQAGLNRSSLVTAMALMLGGMTADAAIGLIREKRSPACLCNPAFERWLRVQASRGSFEEECTRVYTRHGRRAHLLHPVSVVSVGSVLCPVEAPREGWSGTASQQERDRAVALPVCTNCWWRAKAEDRYRAEPGQFRQERAS